LLNWILKYDTIRDAINATYLLKTNDFTDETRFSLLINTLETLHRRLNEVDSNTKDAYNVRVKRILEQLTVGDKQFVESRLQYGYEPTLRTRLRGIIDSGNRHGIEKPDGKMVNGIMNTRNYFTHGDNRLKHKILTGIELQNACSLLAQYLKLLVLRTMGVNDAELTNVIKTSSQFHTYYMDKPMLLPLP
jgi:hypothetical protein